MKKVLRTAGIVIPIILFFTLLSNSVNAQSTYYWVGNSGDWKDGLHWSSTSGGSADSPVPTIFDNVIFDANSFTLPGQVVTISDDGSMVGVEFKTMDWRGVTNTPTFRVRAVTSDWISNDVGGSLYFDDNMIIDFHMAEFYFGSNTNYELDTRGHNLGLNCYLSINLPYGGGGYPVTCNLLSDLNHVLLYLDKGTFASNGYTVTGQAVEGAAANYMWIRNSSVADFTNSTVSAGHLNITESGSVIDNNAEISVSMQFTASGQDFNHVVIGNTVNMVGAAMGSNTFQTLEILPGSVLSLKNQSVQTVENLIANGTEANPITLKSTVNGDAAILTKTTGIAKVHYAHIRDVTATGGATFKAYNSRNDGNNSGWTFIVHDSDSLALVDLYASTNGASWINDSGWLVDDVENWYGITVQNGRVTDINLPGNNLDGNIPSSIGDLTGLQGLFLNNNRLTGPLPSSIGNLTLLGGMNLDDNQLTGSLPSSIGNLVNLVYLSLGNNDLGGAIPRQIGDLPLLESLYLWNNNFSGSIPVEITAPPVLRTIVLSGNQLTGDVPEEFNNMAALELLELPSNRLSGLPDLTGMPSITTLNVSDNYFTFEDLAPNMSVPGIAYNFQKEVEQGDTLEVSEGSGFALTVTVAGAGNLYQWKKAFVNISGATGATYNVASASVADAGIYFVEITNPAVPGLTLKTTNYAVDVFSTDASEDSGYTFLKKLGAETLGLFEHYPLRLAAGSTGVAYVQDGLTTNIHKFGTDGELVLTVNNTMNISDIEVDDNEALYVSDEISNTVRKFNSSGVLQVTISNTMGTYGIAFDQSGNIVTCPRNSPDRFKIYNSTTGAFITDVMFSGAPAPGIYLDIEIDNGGNFYAVEASIPRIDKYSSAGVFIQSFDLVSAGLAAWNGWDFEVDANGDVFIINSGKVFRFDSDGSYLNQFGNLETGSSSGVTVYGLDIMVSEGNNGISVYNVAGTFLRSFGPPMNEDGQFHAPSQIAIDEDGFRYIADTYNHRVQKFTPDGDFVLAFGSRGSGADQMLYPVHIAIDAAGNVYVSDQGNNRVQKYTSTGTHVRSIGGPGSANGQFSIPRGLAISKSGFLFVADSGNDRIQKFTTDGTHLATFGTAGTGDGLINELHAMHAKGDGTLAVANNFPTKIMFFNEEGTLLSETKMGDYRVTSISSDTDGALYICVNGSDVLGNHAVRKISSSGSLITRIGKPGRADGELNGAFAVSSNNAGDTVWVSSYPNRISIFYSNFRFATAADSLALVDLYQGTNGSAWVNNTNWLTGTVDTWHGVSVSGGKIRKVELPGNNLEGVIPASVSTLDELNIIDLNNNLLTGAIPALNSITSLQKLNLSNNALTGNVPALPVLISELELSNNELTSLLTVPDYVASINLSFNNLVELGDLTNSTLQLLDVRENGLTFEDLEPNRTIPGFQYIPQDSVGASLKIVKEIGSNITFESNTGGTANVYQWFKNGAAIAGANAATLTLDPLNIQDDAEYNVHITNTLVTGLTLKSFLNDLRISSLLRDSLALVELYNNTQGGQWTNRAGWTEGDIETWHGVTITDSRVTAIDLTENNLHGHVPADITDMLSLTALQIPDNHITSIPDLTSLPALAVTDVSGNNLDFESLLPNAGLAGINYSNQRELGTAVDTLIEVGSDYKLKVITRGAGNLYTWKLNDQNIDGAVDTTYMIENIGRSNMGAYVAEVTNTGVPDLTLKTHVQRVRATASISGILNIEESEPATSGQVTLFRVTGQNGYDTIATANVNETGAYKFEKVILDDYQLLGFADTLVHERALPTYFKNKLFWEEADTLFLATHVDTINIVSEREPLPPSGNGIISGYLQEDDGTGRVKGVKINKRVAGAGVAVRRVERAGRTKDEKLTLVAYVFTDDEGEFNVKGLPQARYKLNIQYPGYPMDTTSFMTIDIGSALQSLVQVEANVVDGKIHVRKLLITEVFSREDYSVQVYPNPAVDFINLNFGNRENSRRVNLLDINGKIYIDRQAPEAEASLSVENLKKGIYLLNIQELGRTVKTLKVSIE